MKTVHKVGTRRLDGRGAADQLLKQLQQRIWRTKQRMTLATILVGQRYDSALYVKLKLAAAKNVGLATEQHRLPQTITQPSLEKLIRRLNTRRTVTGILLQLPLPRGLNADRAVQAIDPNKDVDGFHPANRRVVPPPVAAVLKLIAMAYPPRHSRVVILGRHSVLTESLEARLSSLAYTISVVPVSHRIPPTTRQADIVVTILGRGPKLQAKHIKRGAIVIDVGIRHERGQTVGDVDPNVWTKAKAVSPVPGGVGPLTVAYLLWNTFRLSKPQPHANKQKPR